VPEFDRRSDDILRHLASGALDHDDTFARTGDDQFHVGHTALLVGRIEDEFAIDACDTDGADRALERDIGNGQCRGRADHAQDVGDVLGIGGQDDDDDLHFVAQMLGEQWAQGPVDAAGGDDRLLAGASLTLDEATAGDATGSIQLLFVVDSQREEVDALADLLRGGCGGKDDAVALADDNRAVGLFGKATCLDRQFLAARRDGYYGHISAP
jgi:hypothetical protein